MSQMTLTLKPQIEHFRKQGMTDEQIARVLFPSDPEVGDSVIYMARGSADGKYPAVPRAATVTQVLDREHVGLCIMNPTGLFFDTNCTFALEPTPGCWSWRG